mmetsp:Transcript_133199/g.414161  ORF Transcript_133199/g.414161 Transcript_133199/m.414161 type:complete len:546 (-) Transcript_133199:92-1729(-)
MAQPQGEVPNDSIMASRLAFVRAIKKSPFNNPKLECDYVPAAELIGIFAAHGAVTRMLHEGRLELGPACLLNATLSLHAFNVWHCCSHEALAAHNEEHEPFQNMVTRLSGLMISFPDASVAGHKRHHRYTNTAEDPDIYMTSSLPELGKVLIESLQPQGQPELPPGFAHVDLALLNAAGASLAALHGREDTCGLGETLRAAWTCSSQVFQVILILMFGRYPHLRGNALVGKEANEIDSFYNTTWRGQGQVDLWMMGEGWHHGHHAVTDVNYTVLAKVGADVEASHPEIKAAFRGNDDLISLEEPGAGMPPRLGADTPEPCQRGWERTSAVRAAIDQLLAAEGRSGAVPDFLAALTESAIDNALHVTTTADLSLLRHLHERMGLKGQAATDPTNPLPVGRWHETVFAARTQELLQERAGAIRAEAMEVAAAAGAAFSPSASISRKEDVKEHYLEFFRALGSVLVDSGRLWVHLENLAASFPAPNGQGAGAGGGPEQLLARVRAYLESPIPKDSTTPAKLQRPQGSLEEKNQLIGNVLGLRPPASRL